MMEQVTDRLKNQKSCQVQTKSKFILLKKEEDLGKGQKAKLN